MTDIKQAIAAVLAYYDLLDRPLTALELFKSLPPLGGVSFFELTKIMANSAGLKKFCRQKSGLYFFHGRDNLLSIREKRTKIAQIKWQRLKKQAKFLRLVPFLRLAAVTGSLAIYNTNSRSDFDILIVAAPGRLWLTRALATLLTGMIGIRRHGSHIKNRLCLNCYIDGQDLNVQAPSRLYYLQSAQEYSRLTPILESEQNLCQNFFSQNNWLKTHLNASPWPNSATAKKIPLSRFFALCRKIMEYPLAGALGDRIEKKLGRWQLKRINKKITREPGSGCFIDKNYLMFHPRSKSLELKRAFTKKMAQIQKLYVNAACGKLP